MKYFFRAWSAGVLLVIFLREFVLSVRDVALTVIFPKRAGESAIVAVPLDVQSEFGIVLFANLITLTPGTLSLHVSSDRKTLYVHVMNYDPDAAEKMKSVFEKPVIQLMGK